MLTGCRHVFLVCFFLGSCFTRGQASLPELVAGAAFGVLTFLVGRGRPVPAED